MKNKTLHYLLSIVLAFIFQSCSKPKAPEAEKLKIAVIRYQHETCTFCPGGDTEIADWTKNKEFLFNI